MPSKNLLIKSLLTARGINLKIKNKTFKIIYPKEVWQKTPINIKQVLFENLVFGETHFLPLLLNKEEAISYDIPQPLFESEFFKNQLYDLLDCERLDKKKHLSYFRHFYNQNYIFLNKDCTLPNSKELELFKVNPKKAIIPFTFGKESLVTFALSKELGLEPILIYSQEPSQPFEENYKKNRLKELKYKFLAKHHFIVHEPGSFRYGKAFNQNLGSELGWGTQITLISLLVLPYIYYHRAKYILIGNEYSNNETDFIKGWRVFHSIDQTKFITTLQNNILRTLTNNQSFVKSTLEPLDEINIFYILHHRYKQFGKYQFSCTAEKPLYPGSQWCHKCYKCTRMFLFAKACNIDPKLIGFKKDLLKEKGLFNNYFGSEFKTGSQNELDFAFYILHKRGFESPYLMKFQKQKLKRLKPWNWYRHYYTQLKTSYHLPKEYKNKMLKIFREELNSFKKILPD